MKRTSLIILTTLALLGAASDARAQQPKFDAQGNTPPQALKADKALTDKVCLRLHNGAGATWNIDLTINPNTFPYQITGGSIKGTICDSPKWAVTGGSLGPTMTVNAKYTGTASCAQKVSIVGNQRFPPSYKGTYGFNGPSTGFNHTSLFIGFGPC